MTLLDRFRTQSRDKHPDPAVRLAFVDELPLDDRDDDRGDGARRRRRARAAGRGRQADGAGSLAAIARDDRDESVRAQARAMLRDIALEAFEDVGEAESLEAVDAIGDPRVLGQIAKTRDARDRRACARSRASTMRTCSARSRGTPSLEAVRSAGARVAARARRPRELLAVAMNSDFKDTALAAVDAIADRAGAGSDHRARQEQERRQARARASCARRRSRRRATPAEAAAERRRRSSPHIRRSLEPEVETASPPHGDPLAAALEADEDARRTRPRRVERAGRGRRRNARACRRRPTPKRAKRERANRERRQARLGELVGTAVASAPRTIGSRRPRASASAIVAREWRDLSDRHRRRPGPARAISPRSTAQLTAREHEAREADARARREALARLTASARPRRAAGRASADLTLKAAERALRDVRDGARRRAAAADQAGLRRGDARG